MVVGGEGESGWRRRAGERRGGASAGERVAARSGQARAERASSLTASVTDFAQILASSAQQTVIYLRPR